MHILARSPSNNPKKYTKNTDCGPISMVDHTVLTRKKGQISTMKRKDCGDKTHVLGSCTPLTANHTRDPTMIFRALTYHYQRDENTGLLTYPLTRINPIWLTMIDPSLIIEQGPTTRRSSTKPLTTQISNDNRLQFATTMAAIHGQWQIINETLMSIKRSLPSTSSLIQDCDTCVHYARIHGHPLSLSHHNGQTQMTYSSPHLISWIASHKPIHLCLAKWTKIATLDKHQALIQQAIAYVTHINDDASILDPLRQGPNTSLQWILIG